MSYLLSPKGFLQVGGAVLVLVAVLGYVGVIGPTNDNSIFGSLWFFDMAENVAHGVLGVAALIAVYVLSGSLQRYLVIAVGALAFIAAAISIMGAVPEGGMLLGAELQNPTDTILHLVVGAWAMLAAFKSKSEAVSFQPSATI